MPKDKKKLIEYLLSQDFFEKKKFMLEDFHEKYKNIMNNINAYAPVKLIYKNKDKDQIISMFNEIVEQVKKIELA